MRKLDLTDVACVACRRAQPTERWGSPCVFCDGGRFRLQLLRSSEGVDPGGLSETLFAAAAPGGGGLQMLLDLATGDAGGPGIFFRTASLLTCASVGAADVAAFLVDTVEGRLRRYILWKRQEVEDSLPEGHAICARYSVPFQVRANEWSRSGYCSRICFRSAMKSRA